MSKFRVRGYDQCFPLQTTVSHELFLRATYPHTESNAFCAMSFAPKNSKPRERPRDLRPLKSGGKAASAPLRGAFFALPGVGSSPTRYATMRTTLTVLLCGCSRDVLRTRAHTYSDPEPGPEPEPEPEPEP